MVKESSGQCRACKGPVFNPWVKKILCSKKWQPTLEFLPEESYGQRSLVDYSPWGCKKSDMTEATWHAQHTCRATTVFLLYMPSSLQFLLDSFHLLEPKDS